MNRILNDKLLLLQLAFKVLTNWYFLLYNRLLSTIRLPSQNSSVIMSHHFQALLLYEFLELLSSVISVFLNIFNSLVETLIALNIKLLI